MNRPRRMPLRAKEVDGEQRLGVLHAAREPRCRKPGQIRRCAASVVDGACEQLAIDIPVCASTAVRTRRPCAGRRAAITSHCRAKMRVARAENSPEHAEHGLHLEAALDAAAAPPAGWDRAQASTAAGARDAQADAAARRR